VIETGEWISNLPIGLGQSDLGPHRIRKRGMEYFRSQWKVEPDYVAEDLFEAVQWILQQESHPPDIRKGE